jgi:hypothetical protein
VKLNLTYITSQLRLLKDELVIEIVLSVFVVKIMSEKYTDVIRCLAEHHLSRAREGTYSEGTLLQIC